MMEDIAEYGAGTAMDVQDGGILLAGGAIPNASRGLLNIKISPLYFSFQRIDQLSTSSSTIV
ncbi:MAG: hypothetical protein IJO51_04865, partial [Clostridia bacterium]|nr:hypothetical protein [Clostridia bacterium]